MRRSTTNSNTYSWAAVFFSLLLVGCAGVERPDTFAWGVNGAVPQLEGYNIKRDYDNNGVRKPDARKTIKPLPFGIRSLNGAICFLPPNPGDEGTRGLKKWLGDSRDWMKEHCQ